MDHDNLARSVHVMTTLTPTLLLTVIRKCESFLKSYAGDPIASSSSNENDIMLISKYKSKIIYCHEGVRIINYTLLSWLYWNRSC